MLFIIPLYQATKWLVPHCDGFFLQDLTIPTPQQPRAAAAPSRVWALRHVLAARCAACRRPAAACHRVAWKVWTSTPRPCVPLWEISWTNWPTLSVKGWVVIFRFRSVQGAYISVSCLGWSGGLFERRGGRTKVQFCLWVYGLLGYMLLCTCWCVLLLFVNIGVPVCTYWCVSLLLCTFWCVCDLRVTTGVSLCIFVCIIAC